MSAEELTLTERATRNRDVAWDLFQSLSGTSNMRLFTAAYMGHFANRAAFGLSMLDEVFDAQTTLTRLPRWLLEHVRLDGDSVTDSFETDGHFHFLEMPPLGVFVFDAMDVDFNPEVQRKDSRLKVAWAQQEVHNGAQ